MMTTLTSYPSSTGASPRLVPHQPAPPRQQYLEFRANVHRRLLNRLNLEALAQTDRARAENDIRTLLGELLAEESAPLSLSERETLFTEILDDVFGLGPLEPLLRDPSISDILVNTCKHVFVERGGVLEHVPSGFQDDRHLLRVIDRIVRASGGASMTVRRWSTRACRTARASTPSFRRWPSTVRYSRSGGFLRSGSRPTISSTCARSHGRCSICSHTA
jgi:hypothetical protein